MRKIEKDVRFELAQSTICALLSIKMNIDVRPSFYMPDAKMLQAARTEAVT